MSTHRPAGVATPGMPQGQRLAEQMANLIGSWRFLIGQSCFLLAWLLLNSLPHLPHLDNFPYILLNLMLSFQAAFTGPILLIAANVGAARDRKQSARIEHAVSRIAHLEEQAEADAHEQLLAHKQLASEMHTRIDELVTLLKRAA